MFKCLLCPISIDETTADASRWQHLTLTAQRNGGSEVIISGHACPDEVIAPETIIIVRALSASDVMVGALIDGVAAIDGFTETVVTPDPQSPPPAFAPVVPESTMLGGFGDTLEARDEPETP